MAKKALLDVLEQTIGKYVKNLDAESLNVALWSGKIELNSLELDVDSVNAQISQRAVEAPNLALPFRVLSGRFESFQVDVPWAHITSRPVVLRARGLSVEVEPVDNKSIQDLVDAVNMDTSEEAEELRLKKLKEAREEQLDTANQYRLQAYNVRKIALAEEREEGSGGSSGSGSGTTFTSRLVRRIIENIQIEITDVHVSLTDSDGSVGACLASLRLMTTDKDGGRVFIDRTSVNNTTTSSTRQSSSSVASLDMSFLYKMLQIEGLGIYLDEDEFDNARKSLRSIGETGSSVESFEDQYPDVLGSNHSFILAPLSFEAALRQADSNICIDYAKYHLRSQLSSLSILLNRSQLDFARKLSTIMSPPDTGPKPLFPEYRPMVRIKKGTAAKLWWKYAVRCIGRLNGRRSWVEFFRAYQKRKAYIPLFKRQSHHQGCSWIKPLTSKEMDVLIDTELDRSVSIEGIMAWRNIADAQVDKEKEKYDEKMKSKEPGKKSYYSYLFGSSTAETPTSTTDDDEEADIEEAAIVLSDDEMRELEGLAKVDLRDKELSKDSKLYDFEFVMSSFKVDLVAYDLRHVASLDMGQVSTRFDAAVDGAFAFDFELSDLEIFDRATPHSLFPSVLRMIDQPSKKDQTNAVQFNVSQSSMGDKSLALKIATFEAVASHLMVQEVQRFFRAASHKPAPKTSRRANPVLAQSMSGSVDLFYDAQPGDSFMQPPLNQPKKEKARKPLVTRYDLSNALIDAWKDKTESKVSWIMDIDIHAPVILVPEMCSDPRANVLVVDLGNLVLKYGKYNASTRIQQWFHENPRATLSEASYDSGTISISDLTFGVQKARIWQTRTSATPQPNRESAIIDPTGISIDFAIESIGSEGDPRFCIFGVVPTISLTLSPSQSTRILPVITSWKNLFGTEGNNEENLIIDASSSESSDPSLSQGDPDQSNSCEDLHSDTNGERIEAYSTFYCNLGLQRLSVTLVDEGKKQLEAHLVSVYASVLQSSDNDSSIGLGMGWFWILDWIESDFERRQRLLTHSNLPQSAQHFSETNRYDILDELEKQGVFENDYAGSTELADVTYKSISLPDGRVENHQKSSPQTAKRVLDAKFHCLFLHWNPHTIKGITALVGRFVTAVDDDRFSDVGTLIMSPTQSTRRLQKAQKSPRQNQEKQSGRLLVRAEMESLNVILNSAIDDLPLFCLEVAGTSVSVIPRGSGREIAIGLGDVRLATQGEMGKTLPQYRTLLGLAPGRIESLLTVRYCSGYDAVKELNLPSNKIENMEAVATVDLSPMRFCYVHSQIMTVVEYVTDGILGALTAQAASSAAEAAKELANSVSGGSLFTIRATSLDLLLPQAAYREEYLGINTSSLDVDFYLFNDSRGSRVEVGLSDVVLRDTTASELQEEPIQMSVEVSIPPYGVGDASEQEMNVSLDISGASFVVTKSQYSQIMNTMDENIGDTNLFLRDDDIAGVTVDTTEGTTKPGEMTHAGAEFEERTRRLCLVVAIKELSLALHGRSLEDPIVQIRAVNSRISMSQCPDLGKSSTTVSLQNLFCEDAREIAQSRQYRYLFDQTHEVNEDASRMNLFQIEYTSENDKSVLDFTMGSPRVVLIPDVISEIVSFTQISRKNVAKNVPMPSKKQASEEFQDEASLQDQIVQMDSNENRESVETHLISSNTFGSKITAKTGTCRFVFVDLGSQLSVDNEATQSGSTASLMSTATHLTETVILQGIFAAKWSTEYDLDSGKKLSAEFEVHSDAMEMFTAFGRDMKSPLQILEPAGASAHGSLKTIGTDTEIEVRAAALTPMYFSLSMHNAALLSAIMTSLGDSFRYAEVKEAADAAEEQQLTPKEQQRIEQLANALDMIHDDESLSMNSLGDSVTSSSFQLSDPRTTTNTKYQIKITMPETKITFINDLQGLDEALFRVTVTNFMARGDLVSPKTLFDIDCTTSILADYFDSSVNLWSRLLIKPWEITMKGIRAPPKRFTSKRLSSSLDLESFPCSISFSEQFLVSLASASRMWSIYTAAVTGPESQGTGTTSTKSSMMTATAARNLITSFPNAVANHSGLDVTFSLRGGTIEEQECPTGNTKYFRFEPPKGDGYGGRRAYGQDVEVQKLVEVNVEDTIIVVNLDVELGLSPSANLLGQHKVLFTQVVKEGKTTVLHLSSHLEVENNTLLPFDIDFVTNHESHYVGKCTPKGKHADVNVPSAVGGATSGIDSRKSKTFSVPIPLLSAFDKDWESYGSATVTLRLKPSITGVENCLDNSHELSGKVDLAASVLELRRSSKGILKTKADVTCRSHEQLGISVHPFALQVVLTAMLVADEQVRMIVSLEPRAIIQNRMPVAMKLRTPMPHTYSVSKKQERENKEVTYELEPQDRVELFTPGPSVAITVRPRDTPIAGNELGWIDAGWVDLPLVPEFSLLDPIVSILPFATNASAGPTRFGRDQGAEIFIVEGRKALSNMAESSLNQTEGGPSSPRYNNRQEKRKNQQDEEPLSFFLTVCTYGVDHTGTILFEQVSGAQNQAQALRTMASLWQSDRNIKDIASSAHRSFLDEAESLITGSSLIPGGDSSRHLSRHIAPQPLGAFVSPRHRRRVTLMANSNVPICLLQMTMDSDEGFKRTMPFMIDQLPIGDGGAATVPLLWEDKTPTGHYAYRCLVNSHQSEIHVVPEFIVFNGSNHVVLAKEKNMPEVIVEAGEVGQLRVVERQELRLSFNFIDLECQTVPLRVGKLGMRVSVVRAYDGTPVGSLYVETVIDTHGDSRLVIKVGEVKFGSLGAPTLIKTQSFFGEDFCRFRVRWTELELILNEVGNRSQRESWNLRKLRNNRNPSPRAGFSRPNRKSENPLRSVRNTGFGLSPQNRAEEYNEIQMVQQPIMAMIFSRFTVDFQRVFKDEKKSRRGSFHNSPERSQISVIVHNVQIKDLTPDSLYPMVFDCSSDISFFDLCVRIRGPLNIDLVKVDLFDLNLAHRAGRSEKMVLTTSEEYLWTMLDLVNRILAASGEVAGYSLKFEDDAEHGGYVIKIEDFAKSHSADAQKFRYAAPKGDTLYDLALTRVSPFTLVVSFRRSPESERYNNASNAPGAAITNYFTRKLKFTIDKAELNFARYEDRTLKGSTTRLFETLSTVYVGRMKFKVVSLLSAASLQDWSYLAARNDGDDEYMEGDILRATGNLAGKSAGVVFKVVGEGVGGAVAGVSTFVGEGIEGGASKVGARRLGSGVSSVVTGVGHGVGDTLSGVGTGAGKILQGAGKGVGHVFGGLSGGALQIGKGIGKGITTGDTSAVVDGFSKGASSVGGGLSQGAGAAVFGTADGFFSAGKGLVSGAKNVGKGFGGAIRGKKPSQFQQSQQRQQQSQQQSQQQQQQRKSNNQRDGDHKKK